MKEKLTLGGLGSEEDLGGLGCRGLGELDDVEVSAALAAASEGAVEAHLSLFLSLSFLSFLFQKQEEMGDTKPRYRTETPVWQNRRIGTGFVCGSAGPLTPARIHKV